MDSDIACRLPRPNVTVAKIRPTASRAENLDKVVGRTPGSAPADRGMQVLEQKLSILAQGPSRTRRNPALDVLTGRVPDERLQSLQASLLSVRTEHTSGGSSKTPTAMVLPVAAIRMAAVARSSPPAPSPWLRATSAPP